MCVIDSDRSFFATTDVIMQGTITVLNDLWQKELKRMNTQRLKSDKFFRLPIVDKNAKKYVHCPFSIVNLTCMLIFNSSSKVANTHGYYMWRATFDEVWSNSIVLPNLLGPYPTNSVLFQQISTMVYIETISSLIRSASSISDDYPVLWYEAVCLV